MSKPIIWSYGGGKQSVAIGVLIAEGKLPVPERAVIADTGREASSTWEYLHQHMQPVLDKIGLKVEIAPHSLATKDLYNNEGKTLLPAFTKGGEGQLLAFCSGEWKREVVMRYLRERGYGPQNPITQWFGFSLDEIGRCAPARRKWAQPEWPLLMGYLPKALTRNDCISVILDYGLPEPWKSRCKQCPYMTNEEWLAQKTYYPADHLVAIQIDREIRERDDRGGLFLHRSGVPLDQADLTVPDKPEHPLFGRGETCQHGVCWT